MAPWRTLLVALLWPGLGSATLLWPGLASATPGPVWVAAVQDTRTGAPDRELTRALGVVLALHNPSGASWSIGDPDVSVCATRCQVVRIYGHRDEEPTYTVEREDLPGRQTASATLRAPSGTTLYQLAEALALKCDHLLTALGTRGPPAKVVQARTAEEPPPPVRAPPPPPPFSHRRALWLGVGPSALFGLDQPHTTFGVEVAGTVGLVGPLSLRATVGFQSLGQGSNEGGPYEYQAMPLALLLGGQWGVGRWDLGAFGGMWLTALWFEFEGESFEETSEVAVGLALEGRAALRVTPRWSAGLAVRGAYAPAPVEITDEGRLLYRGPHLLLALGLDLTLSF